MFQFLNSLPVRIVTGLLVLHGNARTEIPSLAAKLKVGAVFANEDYEPDAVARDAAVLALLYGSGLRIGEAISLKREQAPLPGQGDAITVTGKGNKRRMVPVLPYVLELVAEELRLAHQALAAITGGITADDLLGEIFSRFCRTRKLA